MYRETTARPVRRASRWRAIAATTLALGLLTAACGSEEAFPAESIDFVNPFGPGSASDVQGRMLDEKLAQNLGVQVVSRNVTGGGGGIAFTEVAQADADGYTLLFSSASIHTTAARGTIDFSYRDFEWICVTGRETVTLTVSANSEWQTLADFIAAAKAAPGELTIGNSGLGSFTHLTAVAIADAAGIEVTHVPFGESPAMQSVLAGDISASVQHPPEILQQVRAGNLRVLGMSGEERFSSVPDFPTMREQGVDVAFDQWRGIGVPKGTPDAVVKRLNEACRFAVSEDPAWAAFAPGVGTEPQLPYMGLADAEAYIARTDEIILDLVTRTKFGQD
jgi:tripartite-type tricarboxylate transporter receptor subunit TctC